MLNRFSVCAKEIISSRTAVIGRRLAIPILQDGLVNKQLAEPNVSINNAWRPATFRQAGDFNRFAVDETAQEGRSTRSRCGRHSRRSEIR
jgi:hypothetical protein